MIDIRKDEWEWWIFLVSAYSRDDYPNCFRLQKYTFFIKAKKHPVFFIIHSLTTTTNCHSRRSVDPVVDGVAPLTCTAYTPRGNERQSTSYIVCPAERVHSMSRAPVVA